MNRVCFNSILRDIVLLVDLVVQIQEKDFEIPVDGTIMITICITKVEKEAMKMKMLGIKILDLIMMTLAMQHMVVDQEVKAMEVVEVKVDQVDRRDVVEEIAAQEVVWEEIVPRNEGHMRMPYPTRKSPFRVTVS